MDHEKEKWIVWEKSKMIGPNYKMTYFSDIYEGIAVFFKDFNTTKQIKVLFDCAEYYCFTEEGASISLLCHLGDKFKDGSLRPSSVYQVYNSSLARFIYNEAFKAVTWEPDNIKHFIFSNDEGVYQVISRRDPEIFFLDQFDDVEIN